MPVRPEASGPGGRTFGGGASPPLCMLFSTTPRERKALAVLLALALVALAAAKWLRP